jgi:hypothetical protein
VATSNNVAIFDTFYDWGLTLDSWQLYTSY